MEEQANELNRPRGGWAGRGRPIAIALGVVALVLWTMRPAGAPQGWETDYGAALAKAQTTGKNVVVQFTLPGCPPCVVMNQRVLNTREVRKSLEDYVAVRIDAASQPWLANQFQVVGTPTFAIIDPEGKLLDKREGYQSVEEFVEFLSRAPARPAYADLDGATSGQALP